MPGATLTTVAAALKEIYEGKIVGQLNEEAVALKRIERTADGVIDTVGGKYVTFPIRTTRNSGISYRPELGTLAPPGQQGYKAVQVPLKYGYGRFQFTGQTIELAETNYQAFADMADEEMDRLKGDLVKDSNRIAYGSSVGNGVLAVPTDAAAAASHPVDNVQYLEVGMVVEIRNVSTGALAAGTQPTTITAINESTKTVTFDQTTTTTAGMGIYRMGNRNNEPTGFAQIVANSGALHGLDPANADSSVWKSTVLNNTAAPGTAIALSEAKMIQACDEARKRGGKTSAIFTSLGVRRAYFNLLTQQRRYTDTKSYPGGFQGLPFNYGTEVPVVEDVDAPPNRMWFIDESKIKVYRKRDWYIDDTTGNTLYWVRDQDLFEGLMKSYREMGTSQRNAHVLYTDILEA